MAHFAKIEDGIVTTVIVAEQDYISTISGTWVQTSFNTRGGKHYDPDTGEEDGGTPLRKNYAGIGYTYDSERDAFIPPKPYSSWTLVEDTCQWTAPVTYPDDDKAYGWDEDAYQADNNNGWV
jgi:hypothetical protein